MFGAFNLVSDQLTTRLVERHNTTVRGQKPGRGSGACTRRLYVIEVPYVELYRFPNDSPPLQVVERFWKVLRRRATHNLLFPVMAYLKQALHNSLCYDQTLKQRVLSSIQSPKKRTELSAP